MSDQLYVHRDSFPESFRSSELILITIEKNTAVAVNVLIGRQVPLAPVVVQILSSFVEWSEIDRLYNALFSIYLDQTSQLIETLFDAGIIISRNSELEDREVEFRSKWQWGLAAAYYQFGIKDTKYVEPAVANSLVGTRLAYYSQPPLFLTNENYLPIKSLPPPEMDGSLWNAMLTRRSFRGFAEDIPLQLDLLSECLYAGFGVTGFIKPPLNGHQPLPIKTSPSGGGRNPFEAYVYIRSVSGLIPGLYHYSGIDHTIGWIAPLTGLAPRHLLAEQNWFDNASAIVFLIAFSERTMWKYPHPTGYRVIIIEAGHIAQNILLTATASGLASAPTCAVSDSICMKAFKLSSVTHLVTYAIALGPRGNLPTIADPVELQPNIFSPS